MKRLLLKLLPGLCLVLLAGTALAGGVVVSLDGEIANPEAGTPFDVNFTILSAHDGSVQDSFFPTIKATHAETGEVVTTHAQATGEGHYTASLTLPAAGTWNWEILPDPGYPAELSAKLTPLTVVEAVAVAAPEQAAAPSFAGMPVGLWGIVAMLAVVAVVAVLTARRLPVRA